MLRIEDLDASRVRPEARAGALDDLRWLGLDWDEGPDVGGPAAPYVQSERMEAYSVSLERLSGTSLIYPCTCTRADIARAASAPHAEDEGPVYPGTCAGRTAADAAALARAGRPFAWRFRVLTRSGRMGRPVPGSDAASTLRGSGATSSSAGRRSDRRINWRSCTTTASMGVTQVIRGDDLVPSTPRQILLYRALGWAPPAFGHVPLAVGPDGRRLAKRDGVDQARHAPGVRSRPPPTGRLARAVVRLDRPRRALPRARLDRPVTPRDRAERTMGRDQRQSGCTPDTRRAALRHKPAAAICAP